MRNSGAQTCAKALERITECDALPGDPASIAIMEAAAANGDALAQLVLDHIRSGNLSEGS
jgi:hypothetical protein